GGGDAAAGGAALRPGMAHDVLRRCPGAVRDLAARRTYLRLAAGAQMTALLSVERVSKAFGGYLALNGVGMDVAERSIHALIGPNGAGKTTLFNIVSGMAAPSSGRLCYAGQDYAGRRADSVLRMGIARNFQQVRLFTDLDVLQNVMIGSFSRIG